MTSMDVDVVLRHPGQARCTGCGALLCHVVEPSCIKIKCRRCGNFLKVRLRGEAVPPVAAVNAHPR
ncbi:MAG: hypothetical protein HUU29_08300 [Planctomycetaceae bacterium]|nr:hypothetical protein [Planctomycetaceae bacterium]